LVAFSMMGGLSVQIGDSVSILELWKCSNEGERDEQTGKGAGRGEAVFRGVADQLGRNPKFVRPGERLRVRVGALVLR
jgi:hypothetical protein